MMIVTDDAPGDSAPSGMSWGIKRSFIDYVGGDPSGQLVVDGGAISNDAGMFSWSLGHMDFSDDEFRFILRGNVRFIAHGGMLDISIRDPELVVSTGEDDDIDRGTLFVRAPEGNGRMPLATCAVTRMRTGTGYDAWVGNAVALSSEGADLFGGAYDPGTGLDPLIVAVAADVRSAEPPPY